MGDLAVFPPDAKLPAKVAALVAEIAADGGSALAVYQEPIGRHWQIFALLPMSLLEPTPYQRDLSPAHTKRLVEVMGKLDLFLDPVVAIRKDHRYWTPNGNHRRAAAQKLGARYIPAIVLPEPEAAFQILALNTEKAHNLKDKALEVIRMYRGLIEEGSEKTEKAMAFQFEKAHYVTLGILYERKRRFSGGVYAPILSRVDTFLAKPLAEAMEERAARADQLDHADELLAALVAAGQRRGLKHPYLKSFIAARANPLTRARKNLPSYKATVNNLCQALEKFDLGKISFGQIQSAAIIAAGAPAE